VGQDKIDRLMELIGEMVVAKNALPYLAQRAEDRCSAARAGARDQGPVRGDQPHRRGHAARDHAGAHAAGGLRSSSASAAWCATSARSWARTCKLVIEGEDTEADKNVIESLADPLIHILRNSLDHGFELPEVRLAAGKPATGTLGRARQEADRVVIEISDDGPASTRPRASAKAVERGLIDEADAGAYERPRGRASGLPALAFPPPTPSPTCPGRGVGMDVVRTAVEKVNGSIVELAAKKARAPASGCRCRCRWRSATS
jgi:two-component system chemotaxis sensor kinase CheA